jgi:RES domain-containing protein
VIVWRLSSARYTESALSGLGGLYVAGRWHHRGTRIVYCSTNLSLAALELLVHCDIGNPPADMVKVKVRLPDGMSQEVVADPATSIDERWRQLPLSAAAQRFGSTWAQEQRSCALAVPSAVIPEEQNVLLNPEHDEMAGVETVDVQPFHFDERLREQ